MAEVRERPDVGVCPNCLEVYVASAGWTCIECTRKPIEDPSNGCDPDNWMTVSDRVRVVSLATLWNHVVLHGDHERLNELDLR